MSSSAPSIHRDPPRAVPVTRAVRVVFWINLVCQIGIIVTGGLVRLTGSGLGCSTWPQCTPGSFTPTVEQAEGFHKYIEFGNRLLTFVLILAALALLWTVWTRLTHRRSLRLPAILVLVLILAQGIVGGMTVLVDLHPAMVAFHFLNSGLLVALSTYLLLRLDETDDAPELLVPPILRTLGWVTAFVGAVVLVLGTVVTGSGPHSGDADAPARTGLDPAMMSWLHADAVILFVGMSVAMWLGCHLSAVSSPTVRAARAWRDLLLLSIAQGVVGYTQYALGLPEPLVLLHMLLAAVMVALLTRAVMAQRARGALDTHATEAGSPSIAG